MRRLRFITPEEGIVHSSIRACIRFQPLERGAAKIGDIFPKLAVILLTFDGSAFCFKSKMLLNFVNIGFHNFVSHILSRFNGCCPNPFEAQPVKKRPLYIREATKYKSILTSWGA